MQLPYQELYQPRLQPRLLPQRLLLRQQLPRQTQTTTTLATLALRLLRWDPEMTLVQLLCLATARAEWKAVVE